MNRQVTVAVFATALLVSGLLGGCANTPTGDTSSLPETSLNTTTTKAKTSMTVVPLPSEDPDRDYGTPDIQVTWDTQKAQEVLALMNEAREAEGLSPLTMDNGPMMEAAKTRALDITVTFDHYRPNGDGFFTVFQQFGVDYASAGENLAAGQPTAAVAFDCWWNSETHRANMMNEHFTHVSIAVMTYEGEPFWVQLFRK